MTQSSAATPSTILIAHAGAELYGSDLQLLETITAFRASGYRVVVALPENGPLIDKLGQRGAHVRVGDFPVVRRAYLSARGLATLGVDAAGAHGRIRALIAQERPALVYVNTTVIPWWLAAAAHARVPRICHVHEAEDRAGSGLVGRATITALHTPLLLANAVITISQTASDATVAALPALASRIFQVPNGVPDRDSAPVAPPGGPTFRVCVLGRLSPRKGVHLGLEAVEELRAQGRDVHLEIAGTPFAGYQWYEDELRARAATPGLTGAVTFSGYVTPSARVWDRSDAVIAPSLREPFGNAVVEAQLAQRPVVAVAAAGHLETVREGVSGRLVPADGAAIAQAVAELMDDPNQAAQLGVQARQWARERFSLQRYRRDIVDVAQHVIRTYGAPKS